MQSIIVTVVSVIVGGGLAAATVLGVVTVQTNPSNDSSGDVNNPVIDYGSTP